MPEKLGGGRFLQLPGDFFGQGCIGECHGHTCWVLYKLQDRYFSVASKQQNNDWFNLGQALNWLGASSLSLTWNSVCDDTAKRHNVCKAPSTLPGTQKTATSAVHLQLVAIQCLSCRWLALAICPPPGFARLVSSCGMMQSWKECRVFTILQRVLWMLLYFRNVCRSISLAIKHLLSTF